MGRIAIALAAVAGRAAARRWRTDHSTLAACTPYRWNRGPLRWVRQVPPGAGRGEGRCQPVDAAPVGDLVAAFEEFVQSLGRPGFQVRAAATAAIGAEVGLDFEYRMGEYIAEANRQL